jgi:peptidoglycan/LPS O-acetylase OafA/YrhL
MDSVVTNVQRPSQIKSLTGLRFFAAAAVVFFHFGKPHLGNPPAVLMHLAENGGTGVSLFFILSGFVLAYNYANPRRTEPFSRAAFWKARFARIYPVYFLSLILSLSLFVAYVRTFIPPVSLAGIFQVSKSFVMALSLTQAWDRSQALVWNYPAWTLSVEMFFYLTFPWTCPLICKWNPRKTLLALYGVALAGSAASYVLAHPRGMSSHLLEMPGIHVSASFLSSLREGWPPLRLPEFLTGMVLGRLHVTRPRPGAGNAALLSALALIGILAVTALAHLSYSSVVLALDPLFALLIYGLASGGGRLQEFLSLPVLVLLGESSYAIYILQVPIMHVVYHLFGNNGRSMIAGVFLLTVASVCTFSFFETPVRKWLRKKWSAPKTLRPDEPSAGGAPTVQAISAS